MTDETLTRVLGWLGGKFATALDRSEALNWSDLRKRVARGDSGARDEALTLMVDEEGRDAPSDSEE